MPGTFWSAEKVTERVGKRICLLNMPLIERPLCKITIKSLESLSSPDALWFYYEV